MTQSYLVLLLITTSCITLQVSAEGFTESRTFELLNGRVVKANDRLVNVSLPNSTDISLTSSDPDFVPCQVKVEEDTNVAFSRLGGATSLGNGKIVVWNHGFDTTGLRRWKIFVIDPVKCTSTTVTKVAKENTALNKINTVIPYQDSFDIFSKSEECAPCRFKDDGTPIDLPQTVYKPLPLPEEYSISSIGGDNGISGYLLAQQFDNCTSLLKILSPTFEVQKEQPINGHFQAASTDLGQIRICSSSSCLGRENVTHDCQILDSNLRSTKSLERITEKDSTFLNLVQNLPDGGAVVALVNQAGCFLGDGEGAFGDVYVKRIRADGHVDSDLEFESVSCWQYDFQHFKMRDGRYCLVAYDGVNTGEHPQTVFTKCLKYDK